MYRQNSAFELSNIDSIDSISVRYRLRTYANSILYFCISVISDKTAHTITIDNSVDTRYKSERRKKVLLLLWHAIVIAYRRAALVFPLATNAVIVSERHKVCLVVLITFSPSPFQSPIKPSLCEALFASRHRKL